MGHWESPMRKSNVVRRKWKTRDMNGDRQDTSLQREQSDNQKQGYLNTQSDLSAALGQTRHVADNNTPLLEIPTTTTTVYKMQHKCHCTESASVRPGGLTTNERAAGSTSSAGSVGLGGAG